MPPPTPEIRPDNLGRFFDSGTLARARVYANRGMVVRSEYDTSGRVLTGTCRGNGTRPYAVRVEFTDGAAGWEIDWTSCTCPVGEFCKHAAALVLIAAPPRLHVVPTDPWVSVEPWESVLADVIAESAPTPTAGLPIALQFALTRAPSRHQSGEWMTLRPLTLGKRGMWIRSGLTWRHLEFTTQSAEHDADQYAALREISLEFRRAHPYAQSDELALSTAPPTIWRLLSDARTAGVALIAHPSTSADEIAIARAATLRLDIGQDGTDGDAHLAVTLEVDDEYWDPDATHLVGSPNPHGALRTTGRVLTLAPFEPRPGRALAQLFGTGGGLAVPAHSVGRFADEFLPRLTAAIPVRVAQGSFTPPDIDGPRAVLTIDIDDTGVGHAWWSVRYLVNDQGHDFDPAVPMTAVGFRRAAAEIALWDALAPALRSIAASAGTWTSQACDHVRARMRHGFDMSLADEVGRILAARSVADAAVTSSARTLLSGVCLTALETARLCVELLPDLVVAHPELIVAVGAGAANFAAAHSDPLVGFSLSEDDATDLEDGGSPNDWFDLRVTVNVDDHRVPIADVFTELADGATHMLLPSGVYFPLDSPELSRIGELMAEGRSLGEIESGRVRAASGNVTLWEELLSLGVVDEQTQAWRDRMARLSSARPQHRVTPPDMLQATLRGYQQEGLDWLSFLWDNGLGGILADDMGLGKTVQTLAVIARIVESGSEGKFLVVAPTSVVGNWVTECLKFVPDLTAVAITATQSRSRIPLAHSVAHADIVVTSYALMRIDIDAYDEIDWAGVIFDEAQFVKNHNSKGHQCARRLRAPFKLAITGTPMENNLMELWSLLSITAPGLFPRPQPFTDWFRKPIESGHHPERLAVLRRRIKPMMLRRKKEQVAADLPGKQEQVLAVQLSPKHRRAYDTRLARERQKVLGLLGDWEKNRFAIFRSLTMLRQMSLHAGLVDESMRDIASAKVDFLLEQLPELIAEGHSSLVFSQFTGFLAIVRAELDAAGIAYSYLDGSMTSQARAAEVASFGAGATQVFLISLKAGGFGLNLTEADYCFICDPWWNPAAEAQAVDRAHRIGQTRPVTVYRLVSADTIEEKVVALQERKRELFSAVIDEGDEFGSAIAAADIRALLE
ncbi:DEAD/DEAH box helicase [Williamsia sp.]|uniref:DEAD/DEAH box helicase n=1 Tax=Williamsia sp. TaxID=1872085 RepID=UPI003456A099